MDSCAETGFAPAERVTHEEILRSFADIAGQPCASLSDCLPHPVMVLNHCRQLVFGNQALCAMLGEADLTPVLGRRPGELFGCIHAAERSGGCGATEFCRECGSVRVILEGLAGRVAVQECRMLRVTASGPEALDLEVHSAPLVVDGEEFIVFSVLDVSHEKRRRVLERLFFHDILNTAGGVCGLLGILSEETPDGLGKDLAKLHASMLTLLEEIYSQRDLLAAERGELVPRLQEVRADEALRRAAQVYAGHPLTRSREIVSAGFPEAVLVSDPVLLGRILGNMLKNALEAAPPDSAVILGGEAGPDSVRFFVRNPGRLEESAARQVFKRSFSTKGPGRGLGTYSIRLLAEGFLGGSVSFSTEGGAVEFRLTLPLAGPARG
ncbi:MAG: ATP-binding protein [Thermodesulfobacteriota bacterium]